MPLSASLIEPPTQEQALRILQGPASLGEIPEDAELSQEETVIPISHEGAVRYLFFPREAAAEFVHVRRQRILRASKEEQLREWHRCARDPVWFLARWLDIQSKFPIRAARAIPFTPFPYQVRIIRLYQEARATRRGVFNEKTRQLGLSWLWMALFLHGMLFEERLPLFVTSRKEKEVDDGGEGATTDSLFGRLLFMYERLPAFLKNDRALGTPALRFKHLHVRHVSSGAFLKGEGATANIARGGSYEVGLLDEFAHIEQSESAWASADEAIQCPILNSTPYGEGNAFARIRRMLVDPKDPAELVMRDRFRMARIHWSEHPIYAQGIGRDGDGRLTSPWYRKAVIAKTPEKAAQEYDIEYAGSLPGRFFPEFNHRAHVVEGLPLDRKRYLYLSADHGLADTEIWGLWQTDGEYEADLVDEWHSVPPGMRTGADLTSAEVAEGVLNWLRGWGLNLWDLQGILGDPSGANRDMTSGQSPHGVIRTTWLRLTGTQPPGIFQANNAKAEGIESVRMALRGIWKDKPFDVRFASRCTLTVDAMQNYRRRITRDGTVMDQEVHDWASHPADMVRYFIHTLFPAIGDAPSYEATAYTTAVRGRI